MKTKIRIGLTDWKTNQKGEKYQLHAMCGFVLYPILIKFYAAKTVLKKT